MKQNNTWMKFRRQPEYMGVVLLAVIIILNIITQGSDFFKASSFQTILSTNTPLIILTMGQCVVLFTGNIDISTGITMTLVNVFAVMMPQNVPGFPVWLAYVTGFLLAVLIGFANGILVGYFRIPPMLATYGMSYIVAGICLIICDRPQGKVSRDIWKIYKGNIAGIPNSLFFVLCLVLVWLVMKRHPGIKEIYALGGDEKNTYLTGISTVRTTIRAYLISGFFVGCAGIAWTMMLASANPTTGDAKTLQSIAAALLGGTLISGGWGSMICGVLGALFLGLVTNTTTYLFINLIPKFIPGFSVSTYYQDFVAQLIILVGITLSVMANSRVRTDASKASRPDKTPSGGNSGKDGDRQ